MRSNSDPATLFGPGDDWWHNACLNFATDRWDVYCAGYRHAADLLAKHVFASRSQQDTLVYPIVFLYRQYLELQLKILIRRAGRLLDRETEIRMHHKIDKLWAAARALLVEIEPDRHAHLVIVDGVVKELAALDPLSQTFRYPDDTKGKNPLANLRYLNIKTFKDRLDRAGDLLDGAATMLTCSLDARDSAQFEGRHSGG